MGTLVRKIYNDLDDYFDKWSARCAKHRGTWTPYDHIRFLHVTPGVRDRDYIILAQSNDWVKKFNPRSNNSSLQTFNDYFYRKEYGDYLEKKKLNPNARKPILQKNIDWVQYSINRSMLDTVNARDKINGFYQGMNDAYVCMSTTWAERSRKLATVTSTNCVWLDIDLKDQCGLFDRPEEIAYFLLESIEQTNELLMPSAIVESGGGIHVYWKTTAIPIAAYRRFAALMRELHKKVNNLGLNPDASCKDPSRVLRLCKTRNSKYRDSTCELLWKSDIGDVPWRFDDFCDYVFPLSREEYRLKKAEQEHKAKTIVSSCIKNQKAAFERSINSVILEDLEKLSKLKRFREDHRARFLFNYAVALSFNVKLSEIHQLLEGKCVELGVNYIDYKPQLSTIFQRITEKDKTRYKLSVRRIVEALSITNEEMLDLNLRALRNDEVRKIQKRQDKAKLRQQKSQPRSAQQIAREKYELAKMVLTLSQQGQTKVEIANTLGISRSSVYRLLKATLH